MTTPGSGLRRASAGGSAGRSGSKGPEWEDSPGMFYEVQRLRNELRAKDRELEEKMVEIRTLKSAMLTKDKALEKAEGQLAAVKDKLLGMEGDTLNLRKSLAKTEAERDVYRSEAEKANREADRLNEVMALIPRDTGSSEEVARLDARLADLRQENEQLAADNKACYNVIRAKEKELSRQSKKLADAEEAVLARKELENVIADLRRQLGQAQAEVSTLQKLQRLKDAEVSDIERDASKAVKELQTTSEYLAAITAELQLTKSNLNEAKVEITVLRDELARVSAVASRVARAELRGGAKDEGTIPVLMHLEEVKYLQGEIHRLKQKLEHAEKSVQSAQQQKERLYKRIDALAAAADAAHAEGLSRRSSLAGTPSRLTSSGPSLDDDDFAVLGSPRALIGELRAELAELREEVGMKREEAALLAGQLEDRAARLDATRREMVKLKGRLCEVLGDDAFMSEFGEPPPAPEEEQQLAAAAAAAAGGGAAAAVGAAQAAQQAEVAAELQKALADLAEREDTVASLQAQLEQAQEAAEAVAQQAKQDVEAAAQQAQEAAEAAEGEAVASLQSQLEEAQAARQEAEAAQQDLQQRLHEAESTADAASGEVEALQQQLEEAQQAAEAAQQAAQEAQAELQATEAARQDVEAKLHEAESMADAASGEVDALQAQLEEAQQAQHAAEEALAELQAEVGFLKEQLEAQTAAGASTAVLAAVGVAAGAAAAAGMSAGAEVESAVVVSGGEPDGAVLGVLAVEEQGGEKALEPGSTIPVLAKSSAAEPIAQAPRGGTSDGEEEPAGEGSASQPQAAGTAGRLQQEAALAAVAAAAGGLSPEALADLVERLVQQREEERRGGAARDDGALFDEMTAMLKSEMARLGKEMVEKEAAAERLRSEVGSLEAAKLTAEAMASRLEEMNEMSMRVAALKLELARQASEAEDREAALQEELAHLRNKLGSKKKSPTKMLKKTLSQAARGFKDSLSGNPISQSVATDSSDTSDAVDPATKMRQGPLAYAASRRRDSARAAEEESPAPSPQQA